SSRSRERPGAPAQLRLGGALIIPTFDKANVRLACRKGLAANPLSLVCCVPMGPACSGTLRADSRLLVLGPLASVHDSESSLRILRFDARIGPSQRCSGIALLTNEGIA